MLKSPEEALACLEMECNQTFLGMVQMQYQALVDLVQLIDLLEKACIRFVHFSKENELRSRVFSEKMGLESGWNCHISLKSQDQAELAAGMKKTVSYHCQAPGKSLGKPKVGKRAAVPAMPSMTMSNNNIGSSLPEKLDRNPWFLDFPRWTSNKRNGNGFESTTQLKDPSHFRLGSSSRQASVTSDSDPFDYDMSNRAQLPKGINNIRPHLESMDNVPLLVSLFTDCTPANTKEMIMIMQEYGEVVCVMGSAANHHNTPVFLQADATLAIQPLYPQVCQDVPVYQPCSKAGMPSPINVSQMLNSVASSLSFHMEDEVSIFHLILESRHFSLCLLNAMQYWTSGLIFLAVAQVLVQYLTLPLFLTPGQVLWLTMIVIPLLSVSLLGAPPGKEVMNISTGKNQVIIDAENLKYSLLNYGLKFAPSVGVLVLAQALADAESQANEHLNLIMSQVYLMVISLSFLFRGQHLWQHPYSTHNPVWLSTCCALILAQTIYSCSVIFLSESDSFPCPSLAAWALWLCGIPVVIGFNEAVKRYEIKKYQRYQKRQRLEFGTKLGINSPF